MSRNTSCALYVALLVLLMLSALAQVWVLPAAVARAVSLFPEVRPLAVPALVWGACAIICWQAIALIGLLLVRRSRERRADLSTRKWLGAVIGCLLAFVALIVTAFIALNETGYASPGVMLGLLAGGLVALMAAGSLALFLGNRPQIRQPSPG